MQEVLFSPFRLDPVAGRLWRGEELIALRPKAITVLSYLIAQRERVVPHEELRRAVWPDVIVSPAVLKVCIQEIRAALGDTVKTPQFIVTVPRRGYRFIAPVADAAAPVSSAESRVSSSEAPHSLLVGRETELAQLQAWFTKARNGECQVVFITGEPGIGKTTVVDAFGDCLTDDANVWIAHGQCIEHYGASEAYLPMLEAIEGLGRTPGRERLGALLHQYAPTWLAQMPVLHAEADRQRLQRDILSATPERMLREMTTVLTMLTTETNEHCTPVLVLVLEDLHWSDYSTLDLLSALAQQRGPARLLLIGTYRPGDVLANGHPLRTVAQELRRHRQYHELRLDGLSEQAITAYLTARFSEERLNTISAQQLAHMLYQRTEGHPLFFVSVVDDLTALGVLNCVQNRSSLSQSVDIARAVPESIRESIATQLERLSSADQQLLEAASVAGMEFSAVTVATALATSLTEVEERCVRLARRQLFLQAAGSGTRPDGAVAARYRFRHSLHQHVLYDRVTPARCLQLHQQIGEREEMAYGAQASQISAELARHFELGRDFRRAVYYLGQAANNAMQKHAYREASDLLTKALTLLAMWPDTSERLQQELPLQLTLGVALLLTKGFTAPEVENAYARAHTLCSQLGESPQLFPVLEGLQTFYAVRGELRKAHALSEQLFHLAQQAQSPALLLEAHHVLGDSFLLQAEFTRARTHLEQAIALYDPQQHSSHAFLYSGHDPGVCCLGYEAFVLWDLGYPDQSLQHSQRAITLAQAIGHPYSQAMALYNAAYLHYLRRESQLAQERVEAAMALATEHGFPHWVTIGTILRGWALAIGGRPAEGLEQIRQGMAACQAIGVGLAWSGTAFQLAEACEQASQYEEGLRVVTEALTKAPQTGELCYETELHRLKGQLLLRQSQASGSQLQGKNRGEASNHSLASEAEKCFLQAIDIAHRKEAKSLELRAAINLSQLWRQQGRKKEARQLLNEIYAWFTEGFSTVDLQRANDMLKELHVRH